MLSSTFLHELGKRPVTLLLPGKERLQLFGDDAIQHGVLRPARNVFERPIPHAQDVMQRAVQTRGAVLRQLAALRKNFRMDRDKISRVFHDFRW